MNETRQSRTWETDFVVELRLLDVSGRHIGDAVEQVRSHCAESGEDPYEAFGAPADYARSLGLPAQEVRPAGMLLSTAGGLAGMVVATWGFASWLDGESLALTLGLAVATAVLVLLAPLLLRTLRLVLEHPWTAAGLAGLALAVVVGAPVVLTQTLVHVPAAAVTVGGLLLVLGTAVRDHLHGSYDDPVVGPVTGAPDGGAEDDGGVRRRGGLAWAAWLLPSGTLAVMGLVWVLHALR
ncbi:hypothetical protein [Georgenia sp. SUBG003]|uniref:hypothetical protein n=1 Tax=Georgenia sp. SUBG003 TaxID=1497974 RepID=UPI0004D38390|nr:hypothetical protein DA06_20260 [Georgenia sp. SUBG003]